MKYLIEKLKESLGSEQAAIEHIFCTLGNGIDLNHKGYISGNYQSEEAYIFGEPKPFSYVYPWSDTKQFQPFRDLAGCRDVGFKECAEYFIKCLEITPDQIMSGHHDMGAKKWKENIEEIRSVLLETPTIKDSFTDPDDIEGFLVSLKGKDTSYGNKWNNPSDGDESVKKVWFFDVQWSDCPEEVEQEVRQAWRDYELGNDRYIIKRELDLELFDDYPRIYLWLKYKGVKEGEKVIIHWWW